VTGGQIFVDETKQRDYLLVAGVVLPGDLAATRAVMRGLVLGGQRRVHMAKESDPRRRSIAAAICETGPVVKDRVTRRHSHMAQGRWRRVGHR